MAPNMLKPGQSNIENGTYCTIKNDATKVTIMFLHRAATDIVQTQDA
jgi:hypothetical protein